MGRDSLLVGRCAECGDDELYLDHVLLELFSLSVCVACRQGHTLRDGAFELLSKPRSRFALQEPHSDKVALIHERYSSALHA
ncbi:DNA repair protein [Phytophthora cinnamomi]|uniref:DNA repair protein n=1 Tax=Phytophthora cinnamomi TaxID=4785 RepID=UPI0035596B95|nr:DNA repair protein [Phytophthora cinnamomi]